MPYWITPKGQGQGNIMESILSTAMAVGGSLAIEICGCLLMLLILVVFFRDYIE